MDEPQYQVSDSRKLMYYGGTALGIVGLLLFLSNFVLIPMGMGGFESTRGFALRAVGGMVLLLVGQAVRNAGARGLAGSGVVLDPEQARRDVEPWSRMSGGVLNDALSEVDLAKNLANSADSGGATVKVRCQHCRALNDESSKFCGQCGTAL